MVATNSPIGYPPMTGEKPHTAFCIPGPPHNDLKEDTDFQAMHSLFSLYATSAPPPKQGQNDRINDKSKIRKIT